MFEDQGVAMTAASPKLSGARPTRSSTPHHRSADSSIGLPVGSIRLGGLMIITVAVENDPEGVEAASLYRWLSSDPDVGAQAGLSLTSQGVEPGRMGVGLDLVQAVISDGTGLAGLGVAVASWRGTRPKHVRVTLRCGEREVTLETDDARVAEELLQALASGSDGARSGEE
ncbi:hypothetical protein KDL01_08275 [Actinospica durhamensis]|uniref:Uncharacterized protein n=1 Tax=Actinospica durhamensis TaxID=1508375 RepID=A0A941ELU4_9ACTN|nr:hypothetical protein [Actinospica durhamensis]MBR7833258.1 hypothetical protein [Actinospica durhamensis]